jgi:hypothetical protein
VHDANAKYTPRNNPFSPKGEFAVLSTQTPAEKIVAGVTPGKYIKEYLLERVAARPFIITSQDILRMAWNSLASDQSCKVIKSQKCYKET